MINTYEGDCGGSTSTAGGAMARRRHDDKELFFQAEDGKMTPSLWKWRTFCLRYGSRALAARSDDVSPHEGTADSVAALLWVTTCQLSGIFGRVEM